LEALELPLEPAVEFPLQPQVVTASAKARISPGVPGMNFMLLILAEIENRNTGY
jgi:hypothetical protein